MFPEHFYTLHTKIDAYSEIFSVTVSVFTNGSPNSLIDEPNGSSIKEIVSAGES